MINRESSSDVNADHVTIDRPAAAGVMTESERAR